MSLLCRYGCGTTIVCWRNAVVVFRRQRAQAQAGDRSAPGRRDIPVSKTTFFSPLTFNTKLRIESSQCRGRWRSQLTDMCCDQHALRSKVMGARSMCKVYSSSCRIRRLQHLSRRPSTSPPELRSQSRITDGKRGVVKANHTRGRSGKVLEGECSSGTSSRGQVRCL